MTLAFLYTISFKDNYIDVKLSKENDLKAIESILRNTDGYIISCQFGAHKSFERYLKDKNSVDKIKIDL